MTSETSTHLNVRILGQRSLVDIVLYTELVSFGKLFPKKQEIKHYF